MKITILFLTLFTQVIYGQEKQKSTFHMKVMSPEEIQIPKELDKYKDTILKNHIKSFYAQQKQLKQLVSFSDYPEDMKKDFENTKKDAEAQLKYMDGIESTIKDYRFSNDFLYSVAILNMAFNEYEPYSEINGLEYSQTTKDNLEAYCKENNLDYFMYYDNCIVKKSKSKFIMTSNLKLYSRSQKKLIIDKTITGNTNSYGDMWTCGNPLSCLIITSVKNALELVIPEIRNQLK